jgi:hypothetical protein
MNMPTAVTGRLGRLQKAILRIALQNREAEERNGQDEWGADILDTEAIVAHLELSGSISMHDERGQRFYSTTVITDKAQIGKTEYLSAKASVHSSMRILERRGLLVGVRGLTGWSGANLTAEGVQVAQRLGTF